MIKPQRCDALLQACCPAKKKKKEKQPTRFKKKQQSDRVSQSLKQCQESHVKSAHDFFFFFCNFKITLLRIYFHTCSLITTHRSEGPSTTYNPAGAIQPNTGSWRRNPSQVSGQWGSGADGFLAKKWSQFARKGPSLFLTRPWEPSDPEYQGE